MLPGVGDVGGHVGLDEACRDLILWDMQALVGQRIEGGQNQEKG